MELVERFVSEKYRKLNAQLHKHSTRRRKAFGADGSKWIKILLPILPTFQVKSLLDYGCGKETFWKSLRDTYGEWGELPCYVGYDPCIPGKDTPPTEEFDMVLCTDVLEHVEPEYIDNVLKHISRLVRKVIFFNIALLPAITLLPDGSNAHKIVHSSKWWEEKLLGFFPYDCWQWEEVPNDKPYKRYQLLLWREVL
jgi:hypothetical protein